jgi:hypothetical protein
MLWYVGIPMYVHTYLELILYTTSEFKLYRWHCYYNAQSIIKSTSRT